MNRTRCAALAASAVLLAAGAGSAQTITVTISSDPIDIDWQTATIDDLPGPDGQVSFSEAMIAANNTPGPQTIGFAIPAGTWPFQFLFPGRAVVASSYTFFWRAYEEVTIDGTTQTAFTGDTNPDGAEVVLYGGELYLNADNCTVRGLDSSVFSLTASNGTAVGNTGTSNISVFGGSGSLIQGNEGGTLKIDRSNDNLVVGNTFQRIRVLGFAPDQMATNNRIGGPNPEDRNYFTGYGTWNSEGLPSGHSIQIFDSDGTIIENNSIGTTPDGLEQGSLAANMGIRIEGANQNLIIRSNRIAGVLGHGTGPHHAGQLFGWAVYIMGSGSGITIVGNTIGLDANGDPTLGSVTGIDVGTASLSAVTDIRIGGTGAGEGNVIAGHIFDGITVGKDMASTRIAGNSIYDNGGLGIDLITPSFDRGVTPNDPLDGDTGANGLQNFPEITSATSSGGAVQLIGALHSSVSGEFTLDFFASPACDGTGFGEGQLALGSTTVFTDFAGDATFDVVFPAFVPAGWVATATATLEPTGATSEFGACAAVEAGSATSVPIDGVSGMAGVQLLQSTPNPFLTDTSIRYVLPRPGIVHLAVYDAAGRLVRVLESGERPAGAHLAVWDGRSENGRNVAGGVYFYRLRTGDETLTKRAIRTR